MKRVELICSAVNLKRDWHLDDFSFKRVNVRPRYAGFVGARCKNEGLWSDCEKFFKSRGT